MIAPSTELEPTSRESKSVSDARRYREIIERGGLSGTHKQAIAWVPDGSRVLELGCSSGYIGSLLAEQKRAAVTGVEFDPEAAREARAAGLTVLEGSLEDPSFRAAIRPADAEPFDVVIATDVLEHLRDPAPVLADFRRWLSPDGLAIIAVPNIATWSMRWQLLVGGDFEYQESGLLDRTHVHFFTYETLMALVRQQSWRVRETHLDGFEIPGGHHLLWSWPDRVRQRLLARREAWTLPERALGPACIAGVHGVHWVRHRLGTGLARRFPNLCAPHISLLLTAR